jgi:hypothetical protein
MLGALLAAVLAAPIAASAAAPRAQSRPDMRPRGHAAAAQQCPDPYPATRDPANPLDLPTAPGPDPLTGANFFVDGPRHGEAAGAIAQLLGLNPDRFSDSYSWAQFKASLSRGRLKHKLARNHALAARWGCSRRSPTSPRRSVSACTRPGAGRAPSSPRSRRSSATT